MVTNVHALNTQDLERLISVIRHHKDKLDSVRSLSSLLSFLHPSWCFVEQRIHSQSSPGDLSQPCPSRTQWRDRILIERIEHRRSRFETDEQTTEEFLVEQSLAEQFLVESGRKQ